MSRCLVLLSSPLAPLLRKIQAARVCFAHYFQKLRSTGIPVFCVERRKLNQHADENAKNAITDQSNDQADANLSAKR